jgi:8-oxo-dGTP pyrophosphatase MutT (NUDIX family)
MVPVTPLRTALRAALEQDPSPSLTPPDRLAAVLAPLVEEPVASLVFTVRSSDLSRHAGEISFPGGLQDPGETLSQTALRESFEEIGLEPGTTDVLGALPPVHTTVSGILVVPFVGMLESMPAFVVSEEEIEEVLTFTVGRLAEVERPVEVAREPGRVWRGFAYELDGHVIWGATGVVLHALLQVIRKEASWLIPA